MSHLSRKKIADPSVPGSPPAAAGVDAPEGMGRREFVSLIGASFAALGLPAARFHAPEEKIISIQERAEEAVPGVARWYASTCSGCAAACGVLVKNCDGRPIKLEGNPDHPVSRGGLCARGQATVLDLYSSHRFKGPLAAGEDSTWEDVDRAIVEKLERIAEEKGRIYLVTSSLCGPTVRQAVSDFRATYRTARHVVFDSISSSAIIEAHRITHGVARLPAYKFDRADVIVSFDADFLGTWISPVEFTHDWAQGRQPDEPGRRISRHIQLEARMSVTGANADLRIPIPPSQQYPTLLALAHRLSAAMEKEDIDLPTEPVATLDEQTLDALANELFAARGRSLIVSSSEDQATQVLINFINECLGSYGTTIDLTRHSLQLQGSAPKFDKVISEMEEGEVSALIFCDANPVYHHPRGAAFARAMEQVELIVSLAGSPDETAQLADYICPDHHPLESWGDAEPRIGVYGLFQPTLAPLYKTRAAVTSLLTWAGEPTSTYEVMQRAWRKRVFRHQEEYREFEPFWDDSVQNGFAVIDSEESDRPFDPSRMGESPPPPSHPPSEGFEIDLYASVALGDGRLAGNPWLQELPDPITKVAWGNVASISPDTARRLKVGEGEMVELSSEQHKAMLPVQIQPGMAPGVVAVALGYGRNGSDEIAANYPVRKMFAIEKELLSGADVFPFLAVSNVNVRPTGATEPLAKTQIFDYETVPFTGQHREQIRETTAEELEGAAEETPPEHHRPSSLWPEHAYEGHKWAMAIDLNRCTGCSACVVACQAENNIPVVGKAETRKNRELHWLRLDRYYSGAEGENDENPRVSFQPMLCQQCDNAPCETVCPVLATVHSSEGLNMQVYNRCVGTRYCANNCPYKVRRFNWFEYAREDPIQNLVLNPDVTVRSRGVMEKCTFCAQRIQRVKLRARAEGREPFDGEILPACAQSCPSGAIVFGDINDPESKVAAAARDPRSYAVLEELGVGPSVRYLEKVRNLRAGLS